MKLPAFYHFNLQNGNLMWFTQVCPSYLSGDASVRCWDMVDSVMFPSSPPAFSVEGFVILNGNEWEVGSETETTIWGQEQAL